MSTHIYLRCVTHDPYISSDEVGHNTSALPEIRKGLRNRNTIVENMSVLGNDAYDLHAHDENKRRLWWFIFRHPHCELEIWDEYGQQYSMVDTVEEQPIARDTVLGKIKNVENTPNGVAVVFGDLTDEGKRALRSLFRDPDAASIHNREG